jgi:hypothetical protein
VRAFPRRAATIVMTAGLVLALAVPASADQLISYRGRSSQDDRVRLSVMKRDDGRRLFRTFAITFTATCDDASTHEFGLGVGGRRLLDDEGFFEIHRPLDPGQPFAYTYDIAGTVRFRSAEGTFELTYPSLTDTGEAQLCSTGVVDWTADRLRSEPIRRPMSAIADEVTFVEVDRQGELTVIEP